MQRVLFTAAFLILLVFPILAANNALTIDSYGITQNTVSGEFETKLSNKISLGFQGLTMKYQDEIDAYSALAGAVGARKYFVGEALNGIYIGLYGVGGYMKVTNPTTASAKSIGAALSLGLKTIAAKHIAVDLGVSATLPLFTQVTAEEIDLDQLIGFGEIGYGLNVGIGVVW